MSSLTQLVARPSCPGLARGMILAQLEEARAGGVAVHKWWFLPCSICSYPYLDHTATSRPFLGLDSDQMAEILADKHTRQLALQSSNRTLTGRLALIPHTPVTQRTLSFASSPVTPHYPPTFAAHPGRTVVPLRPRRGATKVSEISVAVTEQNKDSACARGLDALPAVPPSLLNALRSAAALPASDSSSIPRSLQPYESEKREERKKRQKRANREVEVDVIEEEEDDREEEEEKYMEESDEGEDDMSEDERSDEDYSDDLSGDSPLPSSSDEEDAYEIHDEEDEERVTKKLADEIDGEFELSPSSVQRKEERDESESNSPSPSSFCREREGEDRAINEERSREE